MQSLRADHRTGRVIIAAVLYLGLGLLASTFSRPKLLVALLVLGMLAEFIYHLMLFINDRFELKGDRLRKFNLLNRVEFDANLEEVRLVEDLPTRVKLQGPNAALWLDKSLRNYGRLRWQLERAEPISELRFTGSVSLNHSKPRGLLQGAAWLGLAVYSFLLADNILSIDYPVAFRIGLSTVFAVFGFLLCFAGVARLLQTFYSRITVTPEGIQVINALGKTSHFLPADEIVDLTMPEPGARFGGPLVFHGASGTLSISQGLVGREEFLYLVADLLTRRRQSLAP